jgi:hypothetical protein
VLQGSAVLTCFRGMPCLIACWRHRDVPHTTWSVGVSIQLCTPTPSKSEMITTTGMCDMPARCSPLVMNLLVPVVKLQICRAASARVKRGMTSKLAGFPSYLPRNP